MKNALYFVGGLIIGAAAGLFTGKYYFEKKYEDIADKKISDMEEYYGRTDEYARRSDDISEDQEEDVTEERPRRGSKKEKIDYTQYFNKGQEERVNEEDIIRNEELEKIRKSGKPPKIVSYEDSCDLPEEYEHETLIFYYYDNTLTDEDDNIIDDPEELLGNSLTKYGFMDTETEDVIYVVNYQFEKVYEIQKMYENYTLDKIITERRKLEDEE